MIFENPLFLSLPTIIGAFLGLIIMYIMVTYFAYFPIKEKLDARHNKIKSEIESATKLNTEAQSNFDTALKRVNNSKQEAEEIIEVATEKAENRKQISLNETKEESIILMQKAKEKINQETINAKKEAQDELASIALMAAEKIIDKEIDSKTNKKLVSELIEELTNE